MEHIAEVRVRHAGFEEKGGARREEDGCIKRD